MDTTDDRLDGADLSPEHAGSPDVSDGENSEAVSENSEFGEVPVGAVQAAQGSAATRPVLRLDSSSFFEVRLDVFDGPIDLLLHLVKQNELPIEKISLSQVTTQYLKCIEAMRYFDLEVAGEYLVIAATLVSVKSSVLLNEPPQLIEDEHGNLIDPHEELLRKLRDAAIYRDGAQALGSRDWLGLDVFGSHVGLEGVEAPPVTYKPHDVLVLARAFRKIVAKLEAAQPGFTITIEHVSIVERMRSLLERLEQEAGKLPFHTLFTDKSTRGAVVASFVAILELCKRQVIVVTQGKVFDEIFISLASRADSAASSSYGTLTSEFDQEEEAAQAAGPDADALAQGGQQKTEVVNS